jgi:hypothetical protein
VATTGAYTAGATGNVTDVVTVTDSLGNRASTTISVGAGLTIQPSAPTTPPRGAIAFSVSGGSGSGYNWSLSNNRSGGSINATTGAYLAGSTGNVTDVVTVIDSLGNSASASVTVGAGVTVTPASPSTSPRGAISFSAFGGSGTGFVWTLTTNASGGTINANTGAYTAGATGNVTDVVTATDSLGNTLTVNISVGPGLSITPSAPAIAPHGKLAFAVSGGSGTGFAWAVTTNHSGATINATTGAYTAGATGNVSDVVTVTDSLGNSASVSVSVGAGITIRPTNPTTPPRGAITFTAVGGSGGGYTWVLATNNSGGIIDGASGAYTAGNSGSTTDTVVVVDPLGNSATVTVTVGAGITITPANVSLAPLGHQTFSVSGGSGSGYSFALTDNLSGGSINASTGAYVAGATGSVVDVITVLDSLGNRGEAKVTVGPALAIAPTAAAVPPRGAQSFTASGGSGGYVFTLAANGSSGSVNPSSGAYVAGPLGNTSDVVQVVDSNGAVATATVTVGPGVSVTPAAPATPPRGAIAFNASGGSGVGFTWTLTSNASGGSIGASTGAYVAGGKANVTDVVTATDSLGNSASVSVSVGAGISINPPSPTTPPRGAITFTATGGLGHNFTWSLSTNASGGNINAATGAYTAGATGSVTDVVSVADTLGNSASVSVTVGPGLLIAPANANVAPLGSILFSVSGGSGTGYSWLLLANPSGGTINATSGAYTAGTVGAVTDVVAVVDSLGNIAQVDVVVGAGLAITPASAAVAPRGSTRFRAGGGSGGYVFSFASNGSGGTINSSTGVYTAGALGDTTDRIQVVDSNGAIATARVTVGAGIAILPEMPTALAHESIAFIASGGSNSGYQWTLVVNHSGATIDPLSGIYTAGATINVVDTIQVLDSLGNSGTVNVSVGTAITVNPSRPSTTPRGTVSFSAMGGSGSGYSWSFLTNASGGSIVATSGVYIAGTKGNVTDVLEVVDSVGDVASVPVAVGPGVTVSPSNSMVLGGRTIAFSVVGGSGGGYSWALSQNVSGASVDSRSGLYQAGSSGGTDVVRAMDSLGNLGFAAVNVSVGGKSVGAAPGAVAPTTPATPTPVTTKAASVRSAPSASAAAVGCQMSAGATPRPVAVAFVLLALALLILRRAVRANTIRD